MEGRVDQGWSSKNSSGTDLVDAIREYPTLADQPLALRGSEYAHAIQELNKAIDRAERFLR
jgi:hypothetical protein